MKTAAVFFLLCLSCVSAFFSSVTSPRHAMVTMLFRNAPSKQATYQVNQGTANKGSYVPDGLTAAQYASQLKKEEELASKAKSKFPKGKVTESLTEWMEKNEKKGLSGKDLNLKGHRMVKVKYDSFTTPYSPI